MTKLLNLIIFLFFLLSFSIKGTSSGTEIQLPDVSQQHVRFTENKGQISDQLFAPRPDVLFYGRTDGMTYHLRNSGISYQMYRRLEQNESETNSFVRYRTDIHWLGTNSNFSVEHGKALDGYDNYYLAVCPEGVTSVRSFESVTYQNIYAGIDLKWYQKNQQLEYDYIVAPGVDYTQIQWKVDGAENLTINKQGELIIQTELGTIREQAPIAFQGEKRIEAKWLLKGDTVCFWVGDYNALLPLVIDPVVLFQQWGTYYGDIAQDDGKAVDIDQYNNVYMAGRTNSVLRIATVGSHQDTFGLVDDGFMVKFDAAGRRKWGTYYGGSGTENIEDCAVDRHSNVFMAGWTSSLTAIASTGAHQDTHGNSVVITFNDDAFLVKFDSNGVRQWGTYYGGTGHEQGYGCAVDTFSNVYLAGRTSSTTAIATPGSFRSTINGSLDAYLVKFDPNGNRLWGTYYGGNKIDGANSCATDHSNNVYVVGHTQSTTGIATSGTFKVSLTPGGVSGEDAFIAKFNENGGRIWGTYYGGTQNDHGVSCSIDAVKNVYLVGQTLSSSSISTPGSHQPNYVGGLGSWDVFLAKLNPNGTRQWGTYYGGENFDIVKDCHAVGSKVYLSGFTTSLDSIASSNGYQTTLRGGADFYMVAFSAQGVREWGTYFGGNGGEGPGYSATNGFSIYISGGTSTTSGITTSNGHQSFYQGIGFGGGEAFLTKFNFCSLDVSVTQNGSTLIANLDSATYRWIECDERRAIRDANQKEFKPTANGNYAVVITQGGCRDTSDCFSIDYVGLAEGDFGSDVRIYPNPTSDDIQLDLGKLYQQVTLTLTNALGQEVYRNTFPQLRQMELPIVGAPGVYVLRIQTQEGMSAAVRVLKE